MNRYIGILYFIISIIVLSFGIMALIQGGGKLWADICIVLIGAYFLYRGVATTVNENIRRKREVLEEDDRRNDPSNS